MLPGKFPYRREDLWREPDRNLLIFGRRVHIVSIQPFSLHVKRAMRSFTPCLKARVSAALSLVRGASIRTRYLCSGPAWISRSSARARMSRTRMPPSSSSHLWPMRRRLRRERRGRMGYAGGAGCSIGVATTCDQNGSALAFLRSASPDVMTDGKKNPGARCPSRSRTGGGAMSATLLKNRATWSSAGGIQPISVNAAAGSNDSGGVVADGCRSYSWRSGSGLVLLGAARTGGTGGCSFLLFCLAAIGSEGGCASLVVFGAAAAVSSWWSAAGSSVDALISGCSIWGVSCGDGDGCLMGGASCGDAAFGLIGLSSSAAVTFFCSRWAF